MNQPYQNTFFRKQILDQALIPFVIDLFNDRHKSRLTFDEIMVVITLQGTVTEYFNLAEDIYVYDRWDRSSPLKFARNLR